MACKGGKCGLKRKGGRGGGNDPMAGYPAMYQKPHRGFGGKVKDFLFGKKEQQQFIPQFTPQQMRLQNRLGGLGGQAAEQMYPQIFPEGGDRYAGFDQLFQPSEGFNNLFNPIEEQARAGFAEQTVPTLAERFTAMGQGAQRSSSFPQLLGAAGAGLNRDLAAMRAQHLEQYGLNKGNFGQQNIGNQMNMLQALLGQGSQHQFEPIMRPGTSGMLAPLGAQGAASMLPYLMMML